MNTRQLPLLVSAAACLALVAPPVPAYAADPARCVGGETESRGKSAVDDGEIRWTDNTGYDDARKYAISKWQYSGSKIKIVADSAITSNDLEFKDGNLGTGPKDPLGRYERHGSIGATDYIVFNKQKLRGASKELLRYVALHELGHALGLCHKADTVISLMWKVAPSAGYEITWIPDIDKANYRKLWG
ncbi:matrixin family metalloprotease [Streptomyces sp. TLI_105]|uniref:matrixin family metalloprotease n=1 Tax=Streptomyces sp. TLI_105 TaxID=1881019 RepID=UPI000897B57F|nr:matrixin family metalloprotease [Streptomyces sp. TLI_105]SEB63607.1 Matrixin [Streptomyces sp. TLI_105]